MAEKKTRVRRAVEQRLADLEKSMQRLWNGSVQR